MTLFAFAQKAVQDIAVRGRLALGALGANDGALVSRSGFFSTSGGVVTVPGATMAVNVSGFRALVDGSSVGQGSYLVVNTTAFSVTLPDGGAGATLYNIGILIEESAFDASGDIDVSLIAYLPGAPPAGTILPIREVTVPAGKNAGNGGLVAGNLGADLRTFTGGAGGVVPISSQAQRDAWVNAPLGQPIYRTDTDNIEVRKAAGWQIIRGLVDSGWQAVVPVAGYTTTAEVRKINNEVTMVGYIIDTAGFNTGLTAALTLPAGFAPSRDHYFGTGAAEVGTLKIGRAAIGAGSLSVQFASGVASGNGYALDTKWFTD